MKVTNTVKIFEKLPTAILRTEETEEVDVSTLAMLHSSSTSCSFFFDFESLDLTDKISNPLPDSVTTGVSSDQPMILDVMSTPLIATRPNVVAESPKQIANDGPILDSDSCTQPCCTSGFKTVRRSRIRRRNRGCDWKHFNERYDQINANDWLVPEQPITPTSDESEEDKLPDELGN